VNNLIM